MTRTLLSTANIELNFYTNKNKLAGRKTRFKIDQLPSTMIGIPIWSEFALIISKKEVNNLI